MLDNRSLKLLKIYMGICCMMGSNPYEWDDKNQCLAVSQKLRRKFTFSFAILHSALYLGFLIWRLVELLHNPNPSFPAAVWIFIWINLISWSLITMYNSHKKKRNVVSLFQGLKILTNTLKRGNTGNIIRN